MKPLRDRNQAAVGAVSLVLILLATATAYYAEQLPILGTGTTYSAYFAESAGIAPDNDVQVSGVKVGDVTEVELRGDKVLVSFTVDGTRVGADSTASIGIKTLLGEKYLALQPKGEGAQDANDPIPLERTRTPYQIQDVFKKLSTTVREIDTGQLAQSFEVISKSLEGTPKYVRSALQGMSALSETIASRDEQLRTLLANTGNVTGILADRDTQLRKVIEDGNLLLSELQRRRDAINALLVGAQRLADELTGLVAENRAVLGPTLDKLGTVTDILQRNKNNLSRSLALLAPFTRVGANATGNGRWFEGYICGLLPPSYLAPGMTVNPEGCSPPIAAPNQGVQQEGGN